MRSPAERGDRLIDRGAAPAAHQREEDSLLATRCLTRLRVRCRAFDSDGGALSIPLLRCGLAAARDFCCNARFLVFIGMYPDPYRGLRYDQ